MKGKHDTRGGTLNKEMKEPKRHLYREEKLYRYLFKGGYRCTYLMASFLPTLESGFPTLMYLFEFVCSFQRMRIQQTVE